MKEKLQTSIYKQKKAAPLNDDISNVIAHNQTLKVDLSALSDDSEPDPEFRHFFEETR